MKPLLIIKTGSTLPALAARKGDFEHWIVSGLDLPQPGAAHVLDVTTGQPLPPAGEVCGAVVTGSHAMVTERLDWSEHTAAWLAEAVEAGLPVLGICYGHQLLAHALGGEVGENPGGLEYGLFPLHLCPAAASDPLFAGLPDPLPAYLGHHQSVLRLPPGAEVLAWAEAGPNHAFRAGSAAWGVQFHPEFDADITRTYLDDNAADLHREGQDLDRLAGEIVESADSRSILRRFARLAGGNNA